MNCLRPFKPWGRGLESDSRHGSLYAFIICVATLRRADPLSKES
jgi:hypothetical protein